MKGKNYQSGFNFQYFIIGIIAFSQGIMGLSDLAIQFMQKDDYKQEPAQTAFISGIITIPWVIKPFWGIMTDTIPFFGYRRKSYLFLFGILGFFLWNSLALWGIHNETLGVTLMLVINICIAFCNVIGEALLVELSGQNESEDGKELEKNEKQKSENEKKQNDGASSNVTFFFGMRSFGTLLTAYSSGMLLDVLDKKYIFMITSIFPLFLAIISLFVTEKKYDSKTSEKDKIKTSESIVEIVEFVREPAIYKPIILIFLFIAAPSVSTAMFYFYTNVLKFKPEFIGELRLMYSVSSIFAVFLFNQYLKNIKFTKVFGYSTFFYCCVSWTTIILTQRINVIYGIPDKLFCLGDGVLNQVVGELNTMPLLVFACKMCPKNIEGTMYALIMSTINFGSMVSGQIGAIITYYMGVTEDNFDNLSVVIFITSAMSLIPLPLLRIVKEDELEQAKINSERRKLEKLGKKRNGYFKVNENESEDKSENSSERPTIQSNQDMETIVERKITLDDEIEI